MPLIWICNHITVAIMHLTKHAFLWILENNMNFFVIKELTVYFLWIYYEFMKNKCVLRCATSLYVIPTIRISTNNKLGFYFLDIVIWKCWLICCGSSWNVDRFRQIDNWDLI